MKKLFILSVFLFCVLAFANAQNSVTNDYALDYGQSYVNFNGTSNALTVGDSTWTYTVRVKSTSELKARVRCNIDSIGGTSNSVTVNLKSKAFLDDSFTTRATATWALGGDTVVSLQDTTTRLSEWWQLELSGAASTFIAKVEDLDFKFVIK